MNSLNLQNPAFNKLIYVVSLYPQEGMIHICLKYFIIPRRLFTFNKPFDEIQIWFRPDEYSDYYDQQEEYKEFTDIAIYN